MSKNEPVAPARRLMHTNALAAELGVSAKTIRGLTAQGRIPCHARISARTRRYDLDAVLEALRKESERRGDLTPRGGA